MVYINNFMGDEVKNCLTSRDLNSSSYFCLNEYSDDESTVGSSEEHTTQLYVLGTVCALTSAVLMFTVSQSIFVSFRKYVSSLVDPLSD